MKEGWTSMEAQAPVPNGSSIKHFLCQRSANMAVQERVGKDRSRPQTIKPENFLKFNALIQLLIKCF